MAEFMSQTVQEESEIRYFKSLRKKTHRILHPEKASSQNEGEKRTFSDKLKQKEKWRELVFSRTVLQEMLKEVLQVEEADMDQKYTNTHTHPKKNFLK